MVTQNTNPFILPGFGQTGEMAQNPMLASMEMMRKAWEGLSSAGRVDQALLTPGMSSEDIERRIAELRVVENWLRMNLSMLSSTIQTLEVQRSTVATLQAFVASATQAADTTAMPSPLDVALGIRRGSGSVPSADTSGFFGEKTAAPSASRATSDASADAAPPAPETGDSTDKSQDASDHHDATDDTAGAAMQTWWNMLQTQFDNLASATAATLQGAGAMQDAAAAAQEQAVESTRAATDMIRKTAVKKPAAKKAAAKKATAKKTAAKKTASKKTVAKKAAVKKTAAKKTPAKKAVKSGAGTASKS